MKPKNLNQFCKTVTVLDMLTEDLLEGPASWHDCDKGECRSSASPYFVTECRAVFDSGFKLTVAVLVYYWNQECLA